MKTLYLRILHNGEAITHLAMECGRRSCDKCFFGSAKCLASGEKYQTRPTRWRELKTIEVSQRWALSNLEYHENGVWLVWKNSRAKKKDGDFLEMFFEPLWCENKVKCDGCEHRFYCYTNKGEKCKI